MLYFFASDKKDTSKLSDKLEPSRLVAVPGAHTWPRVDSIAQTVYDISLRERVGNSCAS